MNEKKQIDQIENLLQKLQTIVSPDSIATFISPHADITYITKQIQRGNRKYTKEILNKLTIKMIEEIKKNSNNNTMYYFSNWQKDKFRYVMDDQIFQTTQHQLNQYILTPITGKYKQYITLDLPTIILTMFPLENKKKILSKHTWYSILLLAQAYFIICRETNEGS